jgi:hypothetical protein
MSATTYRDGRAHALLRVVLPALAMLLGLTLALRGAFSVHAEPLLRALMILGGGAAAACGFLALLWGIRARFSDDPIVRALSAVRADVAAGALYAVVGLAGFAGAAGAVVADFGPAQSFDARLERLDTHRNTMRRGGGGGARLHLASVPQVLGWRCAFDCTALADLRRANIPGLPVHVTRLGDNLIGLTAEGEEYLWPEAERERLTLTHAFTGLACAAMALGAGLYGARRYRTGYRPDRTTGRDYPSLLQERLTKARRVQP